MAKFHRKSNTFTDDYGHVLRNLHKISAECYIYGCAIHAPSYRGPMKLRWRSATPFDIKPSHFERVCEHGVGHPDPDGVAWRKRAGFDTLAVHGCDGCCA